MQRLWLVRHGATTATRDHRFGLDEPLLPEAREHAARLGAWLTPRPPDDARVLTSPAVRCRETAAAAGLQATIDPGLDQQDLGRWRGRPWAGVQAEEPAALASWRENPQAAPHGGESFAFYTSRAAQWLGAIFSDPIPTGIAITHSELVRALVLHVLGAPLQRSWRLEVGLLSVTELHAAGDGWTVARVNAIAPV